MTMTLDLIITLRQSLISSHHKVYIRLPFIRRIIPLPGRAYVYMSKEDASNDILKSRNHRVSDIRDDRFKGEIITCIYVFTSVSVYILKFTPLRFPSLRSKHSILGSYNTFFKMLLLTMHWNELCMFFLPPWFSQQCTRRTGLILGGQISLK